MDKRKLAWLSWDKVCRAKVDVGLGIKNCELFNLALLKKWDTRILINKRLFSKIY